MHDTGPGPSHPTWGASRAYANYVLGLLLVVYVFNFVDRQILAIVAVDIKAEMQISDAALGFLLGPAFAIFYTLAGIPIARWADRGSRRFVIACGLVLWSTMTIVCGLVRSYGQLAAARFGVGIGEAAGTPPSHSLISDYFPPERRATALSIYGVGIYLGLMFGFLGGGYVRDVFDWRTAFLLAGLPGLPLALLVGWTIREPPRGASENALDSETPGVAVVVQALFARRSFVYLLLAASCQALLGYAVLMWGATFLIRVHQMAPSEVGTTFGVIAGLTGALGTTAGGLLADRLAVRDLRWYAWLPAGVSLAAFPFAALFCLADGRAAALASFAPFYLLNNMYVGPLWSLTQSLVRPRMRAVASAVLLAILNVAGLAVGPQLVGLANDALATRYGDEAIRYSLLGTAFVGALAAVFFWICARWLRGDLPGRPERSDA